MSPELALALLVKRWKDWQEVVRYQLPSQQKAEHENLLKMYKIYKKMKKKKDCSIQVETVCLNSTVSTEVVEQQPIQKEITIPNNNSSLIVDAQSIDYEHYFDYFRMDVETYNELFKLIEPKIKKQHLIKFPIPAHTRLQICLRYLASGDSMTSIATTFGVAGNSVSKVVTDTCNAIWAVLKDIVLPLPDTEMWKEKALGFATQWDFPHCIGVADKRHLQLVNPVGNKQSDQPPEYLMLFAVVDANSCFSLINLRPETFADNRIIFENSSFGQNLQGNIYSIPAPLQINENGPELPYVLVGDKDFPLTMSILRPYPNNDTLDLPKQVFNYRVGRVKKCADWALNILTHQWKIFQKRFGTNTTNTIKITQAAVCLHNFLMIKENMRPFQERNYSVLPPLKIKYTRGCTEIEIHSGEPTEEAENVRNQFKELFCEDCAILLEWD